jgi:hypothetical protein
MTYNTRDASEYDGAPIELYQFRGLDGTEYNFTSHATPVTRGGDIYNPISLQRTGLKAGTQDGDDHMLEIEIPSREQMILDYATRVTPPKLDLTIYRFHDGDDPLTDAVIYWVGPVVSFKLSGDVARVRSTSIFGSALSGVVPSTFYQSPCNWVLYSEECGVNSALWTLNSVPTAVGTNTVEIPDLGGFTDTDFLGGEIACSRTGERRMIIGVVATVFTVNYPFSDLNETDAIIIRAGCDHSQTMCKAKFNNTSRYGGHRFIPWVNPFAEGLD